MRHKRQNECPPYFNLLETFLFWSTFKIPDTINRYFVQFLCVFKYLQPTAIILQIEYYSCKISWLHECVVDII